MITLNPDILLYSVEDLYKQVFYWKKKGRVYVKENAPTEPLITYCEEALNEHAIELRIPRKLTFQDRKTKQLVKTIQSYDVRIRLVKNGVYKTLTHVDIVEDLYKKISSIEDHLYRQHYYRAIAIILANIYLNRDVMWGIEITNEYQEYNRNWSPGYSLAELISFIKWCCILQGKSTENCNGKCRVLPPNIFPIFSTMHLLNGSSAPYMK